MSEIFRFLLTALYFSFSHTDTDWANWRAGKRRTKKQRQTICRVKKIFRLITDKVAGKPRNFNCFFCSVKTSKLSRFVLYPFEIFGF